MFTLTLRGQEEFKAKNDVALFMKMVPPTTLSMEELTADIESSSQEIEDQSRNMALYEEQIETIENQLEEISCQKVRMFTLRKEEGSGKPRLL